MTSGPTASHPSGRPGRAPAADAPGVRPRVEGWALAAILLVAAALRLVRLDAGLWYDEVVTLVEYVRLPVRDLLTTYTSTNNHVLYSLAAKASIALLGESAFALRLPAALFGVASVAAVHALGREVTSRREALFATLLVAVSYHHVWFSQNARGYTGLLLWTVLASALFLRGLRRPAPGVWLAYGAAVALALATHLSGGFVVASHGLVWAALAVWSRRPGAPPAEGPRGARSGWPLAGFAAGALLTLAFYAPLVPQLVAALGEQSAGGEGGGARVEAWTNPLWTALEILRGLRVGLASGLAVAAAGALAALGFASYARRDRVVTALVVLPPVLTLAAVLLLDFHIWPRYFLTSLGFAALVAVRGATVAAGLVARAGDEPDLHASGDPERAPRARRLASALCALLALVSAASVAANYRHPKQDYAGARAFVEARRAPDEAVGTLGLAQLPYRELYAPEWTPVETVAELAALRAAGAGAWVVYSFPTHMAGVHPELLARVEREFALVEVFPGTLGDGEVIVRRAPAAGRAEE